MSVEGPSIKYITLFMANFNPPPLVTLCHTSTHPQKYVTHLGPPIFSRPSIEIPDKQPLYKFSFNCSRGFLSGVFSLEGFVRCCFCLFCQNTSLQQKVKHLFKFQVSYVS